MVAVALPSPLGRPGSAAGQTRTGTGCATGNGLRLLAGPLRG
ncbi:MULTISPECIES: hypothetical protein [unclassified Glutamicibacter]